MHQNPELSFVEHQTSRYIAEQLRALKLEPQSIATTGLIAIIEGRDPTSRYVALRADIDALPITEENDVPYRSSNTGVMHACGHDAHTSCLLGAARILQETRDHWNGTVKLLFQPGEELDPGGASIMVKEGALLNPRPERIYALHVDPRLEVGKLSFHAGTTMASCDDITITVTADGGHAAAPHLSADPIAISAQLIVSLQQIVSRRNNPFNPTVLTFGAIQGGSANNVIPNLVTMRGTLRAMDETWRERAIKLLTDQSEQIVSALGARATVKVLRGYPCVVNDPEVTQQGRSRATELWGDSSIVHGSPRMGSEDFSFYAQVIPGCFFRLGTGNEARGIVHNIHTSRFDIDERALAIGAATMAYLGAVG
jgi:amidohydrolase